MPFSSRMMHRNARENVGRMVESKCADDKMRGYDGADAKCAKKHAVMYSDG